MAKWYSFSKKEVIILSTLFLVASTILITINNGYIDPEIARIERECDRNLDLFDRSSIISRSNEHRSIVKSMDLLESSLLLAISGVYQNTKHLYQGEYEQKTRFNDFFKRDDNVIAIYDEIFDYTCVINYPSLKVKRDSLQKISTKIFQEKTSYSTRDSLLTQILKESIQLYEKQIDLKAGDIVNLENRIRELSIWRSSFFSTFFVSQMLGLILLTISQIMKN